MRLVRFAGRALRGFVVAYILMTLTMLGWTFTWPDSDLTTLDPADTIICLGGGMSPNGRLAEATKTRVARCVDLYEAGVSDRIIFTGGERRPGGPSAGAQMLAHARSLGLPQEAGIVEPRAQSTLQNALFSLEIAAGSRSFILVTEAFHLPRSWASFKWAAWELGHDARSFRLVMSEQVRRQPRTGQIGWRILARESLAIWFNAVRSAAYSLAPNPSLGWLH